jgi:hypothetical protein
MEFDLIEERLRDICQRVDADKCEADIAFDNYGISLDIKTKNRKFCPLWINVSPYSFDISGDDRCFASDVEHDMFDYHDVILSIVGGVAFLKKRPCLYFFVMPYLQVNVEGGRHLYMAPQWRPHLHVEERGYESYLR